MTPPRAAAQFFLDSTADAADAAISPLGKGNINDTWLVSTGKGEKFVLQRLNPVVFERPQDVISNMRKVTEHLIKEAHNNQIKPQDFTVIKLCQAKNGADFFPAPDGSFWRLITYVPDSRTCQRIENQTQAFELGSKLGIFHRFCRKLNPKELTDTLPDFHVTPKYLQEFDRAISSLGSAVSETLQDCLDSVASMRRFSSVLEENKKILTSQVIHGDPKVSNFLFAQKSDRVISLVDLDTVKPGLLLYDIGDALRSCCNQSGENAPGKGEVLFKRSFFRAWLKGYLEETQALLTKNDLEHIVTATRLIAFELGLRFLSDYLTGNHYFKTNSPDHNLHRAKVQFSQVNSIEASRAQLEKDVTEAGRNLPAS